MNFCPGGRLSYEAYNVFTFLIYIYMTFTFIFINLYVHLHLPIHLLFYIYIYITFTFILSFFLYFLQNVIWLNTRTGLRYKRHILHAPKYDE